MKSIGTGVVTWSYQQYRTNAEKEYNHVWQALFRELIQNSNDAGSTYIRFVVNPELKVISVNDNGCGMNLDVIQNKLLVIGGSQKGAGAVGGLGKAKELLFFSQPRWEVHTLDHVIKGTGGEYEIFENPTHIAGTVINLYQPDGINYTDVFDSVCHVAGRCHIKAKIYFNDELVTSLRSRGPVVRDLPELGRLHYKKTEDLRKIESHRVDVTVNGCWMFDKWVGSYNGHAILDIDSTRLSPLEGLTANRDNLKQNYAHLLDALIQEIAVDKKSVFQKKDPIMTVLQGNGSIETMPTVREIDDMYRAFKDGLTIDSIKDLDITSLDDELTLERVEMMVKLAHRQDSDVNTKALFERFAHIINYEPDFVLLEDPERDEWSHSRIKLFLPTQKAATIAKVWTETLKQVLLDNNIRTRFVAGFIFDKENEAMFSKKDDREIYYVNPMRVPPTGIQNKVQFMHWMRTTAVHEITHRFHKYHDEDFMCRYHALEVKTWDSHRIYANIGKLR